MSARCMMWHTTMCSASSGRSASSSNPHHGVERARVLARLFCLEKSIARFSVERIQCRMPHSIPPDKVNHQQHEQRAAHQNSNGNLQTKLQVTNIGDFPHHVWPQSADQLRGKHVNANGSGVRAPRHHVVKNGSDRSVIPGHEKEGDGETDEDS